MAEFDESLISLVKQYPCLYNIKLSDFKVCYKKENAWKDISKQLNTPVDVVTKRWKALRERYTKEHKKKKKPTGTGADQVEKQWEFFHLMDFLQDFIRHRNTVANLPVQIMDEDKTSTCHDLALSDESQTPVPHGSSLIEEDTTTSESDKSSREISKTPPTMKLLKKAKKRKAEEDPIEMEILSQLKKTCEVPNTEDEDTSFGKFIALSIKKLDPKSKALAKIKIQQLLYDMEFQPSPEQFSNGSSPSSQSPFTPGPTQDHYGYHYYQHS